MRSTNADDIKRGFCKVKRISHAMSVVLTFLCVAYAMACVGLVMRQLLFPLSTSDDFWIWLFSGMRIAFPMVFNALVLLILANVFRSISKGLPLFSIGQSNKIAVVGIIFLLSFFSDLLLSAALIADPQMHLVSFGILPFQEQESIKVNVSTLVGALVCFCLSFAFRYATLLQELSDDTV